MSKNTQPNFKTISLFEKMMCYYFNSPYAIAVDSCTHGLELCLRYTKANKITVPKHTYISVPFLANKLGIELEWKDENWEDYYYITENIIDAAVLWKKQSYIPGTFMCLSFQYKKHLSLGRGGIIFTDNEKAAIELKKMSYDGRLPDIPWREQNIESVGYHYYMTPETAELGIDKFTEAASKSPEKWTINDWPDLTKMDVFSGFELWDSTSYGEGDPLIPFTLIKKGNDLNELKKFAKDNNIYPYFISNNNGKIIIEGN